MRAQLARVLESGLQPTHLNSHQFVGLAAPYQAGYIGLAFELGLPAFLCRQPVRPKKSAAPAYQHDWEARGMPVFDALWTLPLQDPAADFAALTRGIVRDLRPGLNCLLLHPATPAEPRTPDWRCRAAQLSILLSDELPERLRSRRVHALQQRDLWHAMRDYR
jgi:hypothetical protein